MSDDQKTQQSVDDRRSQLGLRALINEMLQQVRELNRHAASWDPDERAKAEQQLENDHGPRAGRSVSGTQAAVIARALAGANP